MRRLSPDSSRAFTLLELLIVISIIALLSSIAIPVLFAVQDRSRIAVCQNNLRQFGGAFHGYTSANDGKFPSGMTLTLKGPVLKTYDLKAHSYIPYLLPFSELTSAAAEYDMGYHAFSTENERSIAGTIEFATCPSTPLRETSPVFHFKPSITIPSQAHRVPLLSGIIGELDRRYEKSFRGAPIDYGAIAWIDTAVAKEYGFRPTTTWGMGIEGMFPYPLGDKYEDVLRELVKVVLSGSSYTLSKPRSSSEITDGMSHTIMMIEAAGRPDRWENGKRTEIGEPVEGGAWADFRNIMRIYGSKRDIRCIISCDNHEGVYSFHDQVVNTLFADGHVESISKTLDGRVFISLTSVSGGDNIN